MQQQAAFANMHTVPTTALAGSKKQRELYIGNLPPTATEPMLKVNVQRSGLDLDVCSG